MLGKVEANPPNKSLTGDDEVNLVIEEKIIDIANILGITMEGGFEELRACIRGMFEKEIRRKKSQAEAKSRKKKKKKNKGV